MDIVIIGGGISGIVQARWLLEFARSARITIIEQEDDFGGVWDVERPKGVMNCTKCNVSRYSMELLGLPWPPDTPNYPSHTAVMDYIRSYAEKYITPDINVLFSCTVIDVAMTENASYLVTYHSDKASGGGANCTIRATHVVIANGHSSVPHYPIGTPFDKEFGHISHACGYKSYKKLGLFNKKVLVIGLSFSAVDVAVDLTKGNNEVTVFTRNGKWFTPKTDARGRPADLGVPRLFTLLPHSLQSILLKLNLNFRYFNQNNWKIPTSKVDPVSGGISSSPEFVTLVQDDTINVIHGTLGDVNHHDGGVSVRVNQVSLDFDHVIYCTGYEIGMEFLDSNIRTPIFCNDNHVNLYLSMYPTQHTNLSFIGLFNVRFTSPFQIIDLQAYYNAQIIAGVRSLPAPHDMEEDIARHNNYLRQSCQVYRGSLFVESDYRSKLATLMGTTPSVARMALSPSLCVQYYLGPLVWSNNFLDNNAYARNAKIHLDHTCRIVWGDCWFLKVSFVVVLLIGICVLFSALLISWASGLF